MPKKPIETEQYTPDEIAALLGVGDIECKRLDAKIRAQDTQNKNNSDAMLVEKIKTVLDVLEAPGLDGIANNVALRKLEELIGRL